MGLVRSRGFIAERVVEGVRAGTPKGALIVAAAAIAIKLELKAAVRAVVTVIASELDQRHASSPEMLIGMIARDYRLGPFFCPPNGA
jgi:hypothetical protein